MNKLNETINFDEILKSVYDYNMKLIDGVNLCINMIYEGSYQKMLKQMVYVSDGLIWEHDMLKLMMLDNKDAYETAKFEDIIKRLSQAIEGKDYVLICDILKYELIPILKSRKLFLQNEVASKGFLN